MCRCVFPVMLVEMDTRHISVKDMAEVTGKSTDTIRKRLSGKATFNINEAMTINDHLFPDIPFKRLFTRADRYCWKG